MPDRQRLNDWLSNFAMQIAWVLRNKDFNLFWPIGIPQAGTAIGGDFITIFEEPLHEAALITDFTVENPTALMIVYLFSIYGMRTNCWSKIRRLAFAEDLFSIIARSKLTEVMNMYGEYRLLETYLPCKIKDVEWRTIFPSRCKQWSKAIHRLSTFLWAYGEAAYFYNHRIATERHGPYMSPIAGRALMIRSAYNLNASSVWPELPISTHLPAKIYIYGEYSTSNIRFDLFANPIFTFDINRQIRRLSVIIQNVDGTIIVNPSLSEINWICDLLSKQIKLFTNHVSQLSETELIGKVYSIMCFACFSVFRLIGMVLQPRSSNAIINKGFKIHDNIVNLVKYYDIREELR